MTGFRLRTERLLLRDITEDDIPTLVGYFAEASAQPFILRSQHNLDFIVTSMRRGMQLAAAVPRHAWHLVVEIEATREVAGVCILHGAFAGSRWALLGWHLSERHSGRGIATESGRAILGFAFRDIGVHWVSGDHFIENQTACAVLGKLGMQPVALSWWRRRLLSWSYMETRPIERHRLTAERWQEIDTTPSLA